MTEDIKGKDDIGLSEEDIMQQSADGNVQEGDFSELSVKPLTDSSEELAKRPKSVETLNVKLSEHDLKIAKDLAQTLKEDDPTSVINYGANTQKQLGEFSEKMLAKIQSQNTGAVGEQLSNLMVQLDETDPKDLTKKPNLLDKIFSKARHEMAVMKSKYQSVSTQIDSIASKLDDSKLSLLQDNKNLDELYAQNLNYFNQLNIYIEASNLKLSELDNEIIPKAQAKAKETNNQMDTQKVSDLTAYRDRLEKRKYDLNLARQISIQQAPQIRMIQNTNQTLAEKIQSSINTSIPLWKNQVVIALTVLNQQDASQAQKNVADATNKLLAENAKMLKISSIETAKENERGVVDVETLEETQQALIETIKETAKIQKDGHIKRQEAEKRLAQMEGKLKEQLLDYASDAPKERKDVDATEETL